MRKGSEHLQPSAIPCSLQHQDPSDEVGMRENLTRTYQGDCLAPWSIALICLAERVKDMGLIHVTTTLRASEKARKKYAAEFLVDTGAADSLAPAKELKKAGIKPRGRMAYELADGRTVEYDFGLVEIEFMGELTSGRVIFGPDNAEPLLGVTALESVGILVDPTTRTLKRMPAIPLK
jgi:clan AA aspartic protease